MIDFADIFDDATLIGVNILLHAISAIVMLVIFAGMREARGLLIWAASNVAFTLGFLPLLFPDVPSVINGLAANLTIDLGAMLAYVAVVQFTGQSRRALWLLAPAILLAAVETVLFFQNGIDYRVMIALGCSLRAIVTVAAGWHLLRHPDPHMRAGAVLSAVFHFLWGAMLVGRIAWWVISQYADTSSDPTTPFALMMRIALTFVVTPSYLWMITRQLDGELARQAREDPLTGIANRRFMWERGERTLADAFRRSRGLGVLMIDVDHFKAINDGYGHAAGDRVLVTMAQTLAANLEQNDIVARVGGEEFMVLLPDADAQRALDTGDRLRAAIQMLEIRLDDGCSLRCTISVGYSLFNQDGLGWDEIVSAADRALYRAKHLGRNRVEPMPEDARPTATRQAFSQSW